MRGRSILNGIVLSALAAATVAAAAPALADQMASPATAEEEAKVIRAATADKEQPVTGAASTGAAFVASVADKGIEVGRAGNSPVVVKTAAGEMKLRLPIAGSKESRQTSDGTIVRPGDDFSTAVQVLDDGSVRALVVLKDNDAPTSYAFDFDLGPNLKLVPSESDAGIDIVTTDGVAQLGKIDAPWAKDAAGRSLPTHYEVQGSRVVQRINVAGAKYPVVADPNVTQNCGWTSCNATFSRFYTKEVLHPTVTGSGSVAGILAGALMCGKLTGPIAPACAAAVAIYYTWAVLKINEAKAINGCFVVRANYIGGIVPPNTVSFDAINSGKHCKDR